MLRLLAGRRGVQPLHDLLAATMPLTFGQRYEFQGTTQRTPLTRLIDAARPDPWMRSQSMRLAAEVVRNPAGAAAARDQLRKLFSDWRPLGPAVAALGDSLPLARDGEPAARALSPLAALGLQALDYLGGDTAPPGWKAAANAALAELAKPKGMLRLAGVEAVRRLVDGVK
jgi:hypothetical protein